MASITVASIVGRQIFDSRGNPTVEAELTTSDGRSFLGSSCRWQISLWPSILLARHLRSPPRSIHLQALRRLALARVSSRHWSCVMVALLTTARVFCRLCRTSTRCSLRHSLATLCLHNARLTTSWCRNSMAVSASISALYRMMLDFPAPLNMPPPLIPPPTQRSRRMGGRKLSLVPTQSWPCPWRCAAQDRTLPSCHYTPTLQR